jgi:hypothetical protein
MKHVVTFREENQFAGWPAINGLWCWNGEEILVGFTVGEFEEQSGHNIKEPYHSLMARSVDGGESWSIQPASFVGSNGNPPALIQLHDGRLCCIFGERDSCRILARYSNDDGRTWGQELVLRADFQRDSYDDPDLGYPRVAHRADGKMIACYYWATADSPNQPLAATIWDPQEGQAASNQGR